MTETTSKKGDPDAPPSYADATNVGTSLGASQSEPRHMSSTNPPNFAQRRPEDRAVLTTVPQLDPRSQEAREAARNRAIVRFIEAFLWAMVIQLVVATIVGGSIWPEHRRHWTNRIMKGLS